MTEQLEVAMLLGGGLSAALLCVRLHHKREPQRTPCAVAAVLLPPSHLATMTEQLEVATLSGGSFVRVYVTNGSLNKNPTL